MHSFMSISSLNCIIFSFSFQHYFSLSPPPSLLSVDTLLDVIKEGTSMTGRHIIVPPLAGPGRVIVPLIIAPHEGIIETIGTDIVIDMTEIGERG